MVRIVVVTGAVIESAILLPMALLGVVVGFTALSKAIIGPDIHGLWLIALTYLFVGLGGMLGIFALLAAEFAPGVVQRSGRVARLAVLTGLAWGSIVALSLGSLGLFNAPSEPTHPVRSAVTGTAFVALALIGFASWWRAKRVA